MRLLLFSIVLACCIGCSQRTTVPSVMYRTHKAFMSADFLQYQDEDGFGCGTVIRSPNGYVYTAEVINWHGGTYDRDLETYWNSLQDAESYVERWCK